MSIQKLGQDFTNKFEMSLLPGIKLPRGYWQSQLQLVTDTAGVITMHHGTTNHSGEVSDFYAIVGQDVREITLMVHRHNSFPGNPDIVIRYTLRVDRLLLLNFAYRLLGVTIKV